jgi:cell division protease FtsH
MLNNKNKNKLKNFGKWDFARQFLMTIAIFLFLIFAYNTFVNFDNRPTEIAISEVARKVSVGEVKSISVVGNELTLVSTSDEKFVSQKDISESLETVLTRYGVSIDNLKNVEIKNENDTSAGSYLLAFLPFLLPLLLIGFFFYMLTRQMKGAGMQAMSFGQSKAKIIDPEDKNQRKTFADVAGAKEAKQELWEIVDFLKNPKKFIDIGATIPKGVLLMGAPGTGKTLLARAVAGEAGVPFFHLSGSEFIEMFVGVGASRVRDLFDMAKKASPAIIFVDEIDAIGRMRGTGLGGGNDEREQTLNQILVEMDGFSQTEKVIVMAATNRPDVLDPALVRPGRFDRRVTLDLPDKKDREEILQVQSRTKPLAKDVDFHQIAQRTPGFSGADLYSLMNEAAILAARENKKEVSQLDIVNSIEKVILGPERKSHLMSNREKELTAYHEAGHALVGSVLPNADAVHKVSIISRGSAGGYTLSLPTDDRKLHSRKSFIDEIAMTLGGYAAEELVYGDITTGPSSDLQQATLKARDMVVRYGMSEKVGPRALEIQVNRKRSLDEVNRDHSESLSKMVDEEIERIVREALATARRVVSEYKQVLEAITKRLMEVENIERDEFEGILRTYKIPVKVDEK